MSVDINWFAVVVAVIANMAVGYLWFSPALFANRWMKLVGLNKSDMKMDPKLYLYNAGLGLITAYTLDYFIKAMGAAILTGGATVGLWAGLGLVATSLGVNFLFENRPRELYFINAGHHLVSLIVMGAILGMMG